MSAPSGDSFEGEDASGHSPSDGHEPAAQSSGSSAAPASAKQLAPGPSLDVIREDEEHGHRRLSPGDSLDSIEVCTLEVCGTWTLAGACLDSDPPATIRFPNEQMMRHRHLSNMSGADLSV